MKMRLLAALGLLKGLSYTQAAISAFMLAAWTVVHRPLLLFLACVFFLAAMAAAVIYQRLISRSLRALTKAVGKRGTVHPELVRTKAHLLFLLGRDDDARRLLIQHFSEPAVSDTGKASAKGEDTPLG